MSLQLKLGLSEACGGAAAGSVDVLLDDIALLPRTDVFKRTTKYTKHTKSGGTTVAIAYSEERYRSGIRTHCPVISCCSFRVRGGAGPRPKTASGRGCDF